MISKYLFLFLEETNKIKRDGVISYKSLSLLNIKYITSKYFILDYIKNIYTFKLLVKLFYLLASQTQRVMLLSSLFNNLTFFFKGVEKLKKIKNKNCIKLLKIAQYDPLYSFMYVGIPSFYCCNFTYKKQIFLFKLMRILVHSYEIKERKKFIFLKNLGHKKIAYRKRKAYT
jgi:hypothetical protein